MFTKQNDGIEQGCDEDSQRYGLVPLIADGAVDMAQMTKDKVGDGDEHDVKTNDDQSANREMCRSYLI